VQDLAFGDVQVREAEQLALVEAAARVQGQDRLDEVPPLLRVELVQAPTSDVPLSSVMVSRASRAGDAEGLPPLEDLLRLERRDRGEPAPLLDRPRWRRPAAENAPSARPACSR
jgi:hypothetical protein